MSINIWDEEEEFRDNVIERVDGNWQDAQVKASDIVVQNRQAQAKQPSQAVAQVIKKKSPEPDFSQLQSLIEEAQEDNEDDDFTEVYNDANLRIEQGRLYQLVMNEDMFAGIEANPKALNNVRSEIRKFAKERMEIMLGMRQEKSIQENNGVVSSPFNNLEVEILKQLAYTASHGKTAEEEEVEETPAPVKKQPTNKLGFSQTKISGQLKAKSPQALKKSTEPLKRERKVNLPSNIDQIAAETAEEINREARMAGQGNITTAEAVKAAIEKDMKYNDLEAPTSEAEKFKQTSERLAKNKRVDNPNKVPMPSYDQIEALASRQTNSSFSGSGVGAILSKMHGNRR